MEEFGPIRWFVKRNEISASLMHWHVGIDISKDNDCIPLSICNDGKEVLRLNFNTVEEAVNFIKNEVRQCLTTKKIMERYRNFYPVDSVKMVFDKNRVKGNQIPLTPEEVDEAIISYFGYGKNYRVSCKNILSIVNGQPDIVFYLIEHFDNAVKQGEGTRLTKGDLTNAFNAYIGFYGYELIDFKYVGGIHHFYNDDDKPYFEGINLIVKKKEKEQILKKKMNSNGKNSNI